MSEKHLTVFQEVDVKAIIIIVLSIGGQNVGETLEFFKETPTDARSIVCAANYYVEHGERRFVEDMKSGKYKSNRMGWLCRILYESVDSNPIQAPRFGSVYLPYASMPIGEWPLLPLVKSGKSYYVLADATHVMGGQESLADYITYCQRRGKFRQAKLPVPTAEETRTDLEALFNSRQWKSIVWEGTASGSKFDYSKENVVNRLRSQVVKLPKP